MSHDRRTFLKRTGAALSAAAASGCVPDAGRDGSAGAGRLDPDLVRAVAQVVLPSELGEAGREEAVRAFEGWAERYEPAAELNHG